MGHEGRNWLRGLLESSGKLVDVYDTDSPVRLFKFDKYPQPRFNCNYRIGREEKELDIHFDYERLKKNYIGVEYEILGNSISDDPKKEKFRNLLMKIWRMVSKNEENMVKYLIINHENQEKSVNLERFFLWLNISEMIVKRRDIVHFAGAFSLFSLHLRYLCSR